MQEQWALDQLPYFGFEMDAVPSMTSREEAVKRAKAWFASNSIASKDIDVEAIQVFLARFTADPKFPEFNRLSWFIVGPPVLGLQLQGNPTVPNRDYPVPYLWVDDFTVIMDDETGEFWGGSLKMHVGHSAPYFTINQLSVVQKYADSYGWWAVWHRTRDYNGKTVPQAVINEMRI